MLQSNLTQGKAMLIAQAADPALEQPTIDTTELVARGEALVVDSEAGKSLDTKDPSDYGDYYSKKKKKGHIGNGYGRKRMTRRKELNRGG